MEAKELRIGNWVRFYGNQTPFQIEGMNTVDVGSWQEGFVLNNGSDKTAIHALEPIPLTEEWLLKFGFEKYHSNLFVKEGLLTIHWYMLNEYYFVAFEHKRIELKYVHQLQNLYFALTGTELELNEEPNWDSLKNKGLDNKLKKWD